MYFIIKAVRFLVAFPFHELAAQTINNKPDYIGVGLLPDIGHQEHTWSSRSLLVLIIQVRKVLERYVPSGGSPARYPSISENRHQTTQSSRIALNADESSEQYMLRAITIVSCLGESRFIVRLHIHAAVAST